MAYATSGNGRSVGLASRSAGRVHFESSHVPGDCVSREEVSQAPRTATARRPIMKTVMIVIGFNAIINNNISNIIMITSLDPDAVGMIHIGRVMKAVPNRASLGIFSKLRPQRSRRASV
jgi:hypothetical protein